MLLSRVAQQSRTHPGRGEDGGDLDKPSHVAHKTRMLKQADELPRWASLLAYIEHSRKQCFFGCSSLTSQDPAQGLRLYRQLQAGGHEHPELRVEPLPHARCQAALPGNSRVKVPRLFATYLRHGAQILGPPALDPIFGTIDFLTYVRVTSEHRTAFGLCTS